MNKGKRVGIVGAGNVGSTVAYSLAMLGSAHEIILRDNKIDIAKGKALDMSQAASAIRSHTVVSVAETMEELPRAKPWICHRLHRLSVVIQLCLLLRQWKI